MSTLTKALKEEKFHKAGFETLVFIASADEDDGLITCGNAILSGSLPRCEYKRLVEVIAK